MSQTILIVENNEIDAEFFRMVLQHAGYNTITAGEGSTALYLAQMHRPDLILMDIGLSDVSGLEVTHWIKRDKSLQHIPVIAITGFAMSGDRERILGAGCDGYIPKPTSVEPLVSTVRGFLAQGPR